MVKIRLTRRGRKNAPSYRVVAIDSRSKRDGKFLEILGHYNPTEPNDKFKLNQERYDYWISVGAQPSDTVKKLIGGKYVFKKYDPNAQPEEEGEDSESQPEEDSSAEKVEENKPAETETETKEDSTETEDKK